jgi:hypothetical protein
MLSAGIVALTPEDTAALVDMASILSVKPAIVQGRPVQIADSSRNQAGKIAKGVILEAQADGAHFEFRHMAIVTIDHPATAFAGQNSLIAWIVCAHNAL